MNDPAWLTRLEKATGRGGHQMSGFVANEIAKEFREQQAEIERLKSSLYTAIAIIENEAYPQCRGNEKSERLVRWAAELREESGLGDWQPHEDEDENHEK